MDSLDLAERTHDTGWRPQPAPEQAPCVREPAALEDLAQRILIFHARFRECFITRTRNVIDYSRNSTVKSSDRVKQLVA